MAVNQTSASKILAVLTVLLKNFAHGFNNAELARATGFSASDITRYVKTLEESGFAERITETNRIRPSVNLAKSAVQIQLSLDNAERKIQETRNRLYKG